MNHTFQYILLCQSPALFLAAIVLLISHFSRKRNHRVLAVIDLIFAIACAACGIALYFVGMSKSYFTIHDFYLIRTWGWIGVGIVGIITVLLICRSFKRASDKRKVEKETNRSENVHQLELEKAKAEAYEAGKAEAIEASKAASRETEKVADPTPAPSGFTPVEPEANPTSGEIH